MQIVTEPSEARQALASLPRPLGFVPTMGALHEGHLALLRQARRRDTSVAASIFVNPMQFGQGEDFERYPRAVEGDRRHCEAAGVDVLFVPSPKAMYPADFSTSVDAGALGDAYEGAIRPEHFRGVATIVVKLLHVIGPDALYLGQKDAQQTAVLRRVVRDLNFPIAVEIVETVREADGLALSSRNAYLNERERAAAPTLHRALVALRDALQEGAPKEAAIARAHQTLDPSAKADYFDVVDALTFTPIDPLRPEAFVIGAARFGTTRLIDNLWIRT